MNRKLQPVSIDGIEFDALIKSDEDLSNDIPQYPVEKGYEVSDTMIIKPLVLELTVFVSNTPVTHLQRFGGAEACQTRVDDVVARLKKMRADKKLVTITTNDTTYKNMGLENMRVSKSLEVGYARKIPMTFKEVNITSTETVAIPEEYGKSGTTGADAGNAVTSSSSVSGSTSGGSVGSSNSTILHSVLGGLV